MDVFAKVRDDRWRSLRLVEREMKTGGRPVYIVGQAVAGKAERLMTHEGAHANKVKVK